MALTSALQRNSEYDDSKKRSCYISETSEIAGKVSDRLGKLKSSSETWKTRVEEKDASKFTVAAKIQQPLKLPFRKSETKQSPAMAEFQSSNPTPLGLAKSPSMVVSSAILNGSSKSISPFKRSLSVPGEENTEPQPTTNGSSSNYTAGTKVAVPKFDEDEQFSTFFTRVDRLIGDQKAEAEEDDEEAAIDVADFDAIKSTQR